MAQFETWIKVNYCYNTENYYNENSQASQRLKDNEKEKEAKMRLLSCAVLDDGTKLQELLYMQTVELSLFANFQ